ncbi:MAG: hypothetical protein ACR2PT_22660 [Endozoicomonas sp.]
MRWAVFVLLLSLFPPVMAEQPEKPLPAYRVVIIDRFFPPAEGFETEEQRDEHGWLYGMMDLDQDDRKEPFYHGDVVRLLAAHPKITFITYPIQDRQSPMAEILRNLRKINARLDMQPVAALVLSWESSTLISAFEKPLKLENAWRYKTEVKRMGEQDLVWKDTYQIILELEKLAGKGVSVYLIAGNGGRGMVNTFSFAEGTTTVGATEKELGHFVAENPFVDTHAQAAYQVKRIDDSSGKPLGYDIDGDLCPDIPLNRLTGYDNDRKEYPKSLWRPLIGSSFAAPVALKSALFSDLELSTCVAER